MDKFSSLLGPTPESKCRFTCFKLHPTKPNKRKVCYLQCKIRETENKISIIKRAITQCKKFKNSKDASECRNKLVKIYMKMAGKIAKYKVELERITPAALTELFGKRDWKTVTPPKTNPFAQKWIARGLVAATAAIPLPGIMAIAIFASDLNTYKCASRCSKVNRKDFKLCNLTCEVKGAEWTRKWIDSEIKKCNNAENFEKCRNKLYKLLSKWKPREVKAKIKLKEYLRSRKDKK